MIGIAVAVITVSFAPAETPRQVVTWRDADGQTKSFTLATDDPRLKQFRRSLSAWYGRWPTKATAVAKWRKEIAERYAEGLPSSQVTIRQASFTDTSVAASLTDRSESEIASTPRQQTFGPESREYWLAVSADAETYLQAQQQVINARRGAKVAPPIEFGETIVPGPSRLTLSRSVAIGGMIGLVALVWSLIVPSMRLPGAYGSPDLAELTATGTIRLEIPAGWVRIHQSWTVWARRSAYVAVVVWALYAVLI